MPFAVVPRAPRIRFARRHTIAAAILTLLIGAPAGSVHAQVTLTQSVSQAITNLNSVSCNAGATAENSYFRTFTLANYGVNAPFAIASVDVGIELAQAAGGAVPLEISIFGNSTGVPGTLASFGAPLFSQSFSVANQALTLMNFLTPALVTTPGFTVQVRSPNLQPTGGRFFIGSNAAGQTAPSYLAAPDCSSAEPANLASLGFPNMHIVMNVTGAPVSTVPEPSAYALMAAGLAGIAAVAKRRRRTPVA